MRWIAWLLLNAGLIALLLAIPLVNTAMIVAGGSLVLAAVVLLLLQLVQIRSPLASKARGLGCGGTRFYVAGLGYLLLGAFLGTGLYLGWSAWLHLPAIKEVHVHSNLWGFASLIFAGLMVDLPIWGQGESQLQGRRVNAIFLLMTTGALGLALGPWLGSGPLQAGGLVLHVLGTFLLLLWAIRQLRHSRSGWTAGRLHILASYAWLLLVAVLGPVVVFLPQSNLAQNTVSQGSPLLIYGWLMQFLLAVLPLLYVRAFTPERPAGLGGNGLTLVAANAGAVLYVGGLLRPGAAALLQGLAFAAFALAMLPVAIQLWRTVQVGAEGIAAPASTGAMIDR